MPNQIELSWIVDTVGTPLSPANAVTRLAAVELYQSAHTDPVLGQLFGLTVFDDETVIVGTTAKRTLTLNLDSQNDPTAPPPFPCHPRASTPPELPYELRSTVPLARDVPAFAVVRGSATVATTVYQGATLVVGDQIQFLLQQGVFYEVAAVGSSQIGLTTPYTGRSGNTRGFKEVPTPATIVGVYSTSELDTATIATVVPAIANGAGARGMTLTYDDSEGNGPFTIDFTLTGKHVKQLTLDPGSVDLFQIIDVTIDAVGGFGNSVGQITFVELSAAVPIIPDGTPIGDPLNAFEGRTFISLTDESQLLISRALAYLPPSYAALAQQGSSQLASPASPTNAQLSTPLGQFVQEETAAPPPAPPRPPATVPMPTFLSGYFTRTLQLALAGVPVQAQAITFL